MKVQAQIKGTIPSKSNCYKVGIIKGKGMMYKSPALKKYESSFFLQLPPRYRNLQINNFFALHVEVFYPSNRSDLDNSFKILLDCLQSVTKTIKNDNKCVNIVASKAVDKVDPRVEFTLTTLF